MFKNLTQFAQALRNATQMNSKLLEIKHRLKAHRIERRCVTTDCHVMMNGLGKIESLGLGRGDGESAALVQQLCNQAMLEVRRLHLEAVRELTAGMNVVDWDQMAGELEDW